jgi:hypothetical protein
MEDHTLEENPGESLQAPKANLSSFIAGRCQVSSQTTSNSQYGEKLFKFWKCLYCKDIPES